MTEEPTGPIEQVRELYFDLRKAGYTADLAQTMCAIAVVANGVSALAKVLGTLAADHYRAGVPADLALLIGHADTAANVGFRIAAGALDLEARDGE